MPGIFQAICTEQHGLSFGWYGPLRNTRAEADKDCENHKKAYPNHNPTVTEDLMLPAFLSQAVEEKNQHRQAVRTRFVVALDSLAEDGTHCQVALCTGPKISVPYSVLKGLRFFGSVQNGKDSHDIFVLDFDDSTDAGQLICQLASEIERLASERGPRVMVAPAGENLRVQEEIVPTNLVATGLPLPLESTTQAKFACSGYACAADPQYAYWNAPSDITGFAFNRAVNCICAQIVKLGPRQLRVQHFSLGGVICGTRYDGQAYVDVALA